MTFPSSIYAGDSIQWEEDDFSTDITSVVYYFRTNDSSGASVSGTLSNFVWSFSLSSAVSAGMTPGFWNFQAIAQTPAGSATVRTGSFTVVASLAFSGTAIALDSRSTARRRLDEAQEAAHKLATGSKEYRIGTRTYKREDLDKLNQYIDLLKADVARESIAEKIKSGQGDPRRVFVRFT